MTSAILLGVQAACIVITALVIADTIRINSETQRRLKAFRERQTTAAIPQDSHASEPSDHAGTQPRTAGWPLAAEHRRGGEPG